MRSAQIIPIEPYLIRRNGAGDRQWAAFVDRVEDRAAAHWNLDGVPDPIIWDLAQLTDWPSIARHFGLDGWA